MTASTPGQITVNSKDEIFARFREANYKDCRINAFPKYTSYNGINRQPANFIFIDLDLNDFGSRDMDKLDKARHKTHKKIAEVFGDQVIPTILWTGGGYHIYLPLTGNIVLEQYDVFAEFADWWKIHECKDLTSVFMGFAERFLTGGKNDKGHTPTVKSCLLRVPYTINSKYDDDYNEVRILQSAYSCSGGADGDISGSETIPTGTPTVAAVQYILQDFRYYLFDHQTKRKLEELKQSTKKYQNESKSDRILKRMQAKARRMGMVVNEKRFQEQRQKFAITSGDSSGSSVTSAWVESLLKIGIADFRKRAVSLILAPYLLHKKKLSEEQAADILREWLVNRCDPLRHLDFKPDRKIREALYYSQQSGILHMKFETLKKQNPELCHKIEEEFSAK